LVAANGHIRLVCILCGKRNRFVRTLIPAITQSIKQRAPPPVYVYGIPFFPASALLP
jgi:hypothetical protein